MCTLGHLVLTMCTLGHLVLTMCTRGYLVLTMCTRGYLVLTMCTIGYLVLTMCTLTCTNMSTLLYNRCLHAVSEPPTAMQPVDSHNKPFKPYELIISLIA